jgi:hypothetical protein
MTIFHWNNTLKKLENKEILPGPKLEELAEREVYKSLKTFMKNGGKSDIVKVYYCCYNSTAWESNLIKSYEDILRDFKGELTYIRKWTRYGTQ